MRHPRCLSLASTVVLCWCVVDARQVDLRVVDRIKGEAFDRSEVMEHVRYLTDVHGPRLSGSPQYEEAATWAVSRLTSYGVSNARLDRWGPFGRSWSLEQYSVEQIAPQSMSLHAAPLAWSAPTRTPVVGEALLAPLDVSFWRGPKKMAQALAEYRKTWSGKLRGRIVLLTAAPDVNPRSGPAFTRYSATELAEMAEAPDPSKAPVVTSVDEVPWPERPDDLMKLFVSMPDSLADQFFDRYAELVAERGTFFAREGVSAILMADERARDGLLFAEEAGSFRAQDPLAPPTFVVTNEHYARMLRLIEHKQPVRLKVELKATVSQKDVDGINVVGEIPGSSRKDEIVMIGAHFDSWHTASGATDNATGSAVMIEVMRILKVLNLKLDRTVRIALWGGEEQGLLGSRAYVKTHFADPKTMQVTAEHGKLSGYFNLDNGSGRIRGVYLQGHDAMRPLFEQWLAPFRDLGVTTITIRNTGGTDHLSFTRVGLPGFQFIQDPLDYETLTHHSNVDTYEHVVAADLMQASAVIASVVYHAANHPERLPRRPLPGATGEGRKPSGGGM
jgi:carboxypeptidase Q